MSNETDTLRERCRQILNTSARRAEYELGAPDADLEAFVLAEIQRAKCDDLSKISQGLGVDSTQALADIRRKIEAFCSNPVDFEELRRVANAAKIGEADARRREDFARGMWGQLATLPVSTLVLTRAVEGLADAMVLIMQHEREECARVAAEKADTGGCDSLGPMDPETGGRECSLEARGGTCLCLAHSETAEEIAFAIRKRGEA